MQGELVISAPWHTILESSLQSRDVNRYRKFYLSSTSTYTGQLVAT